MRWFIIWNDTWQWSHSSHLLKINFAKVKPFIKSYHDVMQIAHMAPRSLHTTLHRCYHITWQHYRRMWSRAKINRVVVWFIQRWYIFKANSSYGKFTACSLCQSVVTPDTHDSSSRWLKQKSDKKWIIKSRSDFLYWQVWVSPPTLM